MDRGVGEVKSMTRIEADNIARALLRQFTEHDLILLGWSLWDISGPVLGGSRLGAIFLRTMTASRSGQEFRHSDI
jgi:hypothetical protein